MVDADPPSRPGPRTHDVTSFQRALDGFEADPSARTDDQDDAMVSSLVGSHRTTMWVASRIHESLMRTALSGSTVDPIDHGDRIALETRHIT
jgi:hypothetical protein